MNIVSRIAAGAAAFALVALLSLPIAGAAGGDGTGPVPGTGRQVVSQGGNVQKLCKGPCGRSGKGQGHPCRSKCQNCCRGGHGQAGHHKGGFVDKDGDGICDHNPNNGKVKAPAK